jgi:hypothetical protein
MSDPHIIRQNHPHQVEISEGSRHASSRHAQDTHPIPSESSPPMTQSILGTSSVGSSQASPQVLPTGSDTHHAWFSDSDLSQRLHRLQLKNAQLSQQLSRYRSSGRLEDPHE